MRFPESKIKEAILHPESDIRARATCTFATPGCRDASSMPLVVKAIQNCGRHQA
jgi:hypothetical protein